MPTIAENQPGTTADTAELPTVYLIVAPSVRQSEHWPGVRADITRRLKNAQAADFTGLFTSSADYRQRWDEVAATLAGAVIIPRRRGKYLVAGHVALREARHIAALGKPVLVYTPQGFVRWSAVQVRDVHGGRQTAAELVTGARQ